MRAAESSLLTACLICVAATWRVRETPRRISDGLTRHSDGRTRHSDGRSRPASSHPLRHPSHSQPQTPHAQPALVAGTDHQIYHRQHPALPIHCYSCMNMAFKHHWHKLRHFYYPQKNFTDECITMDRPSRLPSVPCSHSFCISLFEPRYIAGYFAGHNVVRGCLSNLLKYGAQGLRTQIHDGLLGGPHRQFCSTTSATELFPPLRRRPSQKRPARANAVAARPIKYCVCMGNECNTFVTDAAPSPSFSHLILLLLLACTAAA